MAKHAHVEPLRKEALAGLPDMKIEEVFGNLPLLAKLLAALSTGTGSFSTFTPLGRRWVVILDHEPASDL